MYDKRFKKGNSKDDITIHDMKEIHFLTPALDPAQRINNI